MVQQEHNVKRMVQIHLSGPSLENLICILMTDRIILLKQVQYVVCARSEMTKSI